MRSWRMPTAPIGGCLCSGLLLLAYDGALASVALQVAGTAGELRWDVGAGLLILGSGFLEAWRGWLKVRRLLAVVVLGWSLSVIGGEPRALLGQFGALVPTAPLWGAPTHQTAALLCAFFSLLGSARCATPRTWFLAQGAVVGLLALGLVWNLGQNALRLSWAWDWIEAAPLLFLGGLYYQQHAWGRLQGAVPGAGYLTLLQLSRASLLASAHHLSLPANVGQMHSEWAAAAIFTAPSPHYAGWLCGFSLSCLWYVRLAPNDGLGRCARGASKPLRRLSAPAWLREVHGRTGLLLVAALLPLWADFSLNLVVPLFWAWAALPVRPARGVRSGEMLVIWRWPLHTHNWYRGATALLGQLGLMWAGARPNRHSLGAFFRYSLQIVIPYFRPTSVFGFALLVGIYAQMYSGFLLALYYLPDPTFVIPIREDLFMEVWWFVYVYKMHVLGVDLLFVLSYLHILKKLYLKNYSEGDLDGWFTGAYAFLIYHLVVFLGITLSTNHLGDVTVMIAANIYWSLFFRWHKVYAPFFTNKHLSVDQLTRFMIAHYLSAWYYTYLVQAHVMFIHEMWDPSSNRSLQQSTATPKGSWVWDALKKEVMTMFALYMTLGVSFFFMLHPDVHVVNYSFFEQWSETEMEEVNFFIVAPHWYFRPHMGLLTVCAHHYEGLAWLLGFYALLCYTPHLFRFWNRPSRGKAQTAETTPMRHSGLQEVLYVGFFGSMLYVGGTLPCGRFYYENIDGFFGNAFLRLSYEYLYLYLGCVAHVADQLERRYAAGAVAVSRAVVIDRDGVAQEPELSIAESADESVAPTK